MILEVTENKEESRNNEEELVSSMQKSFEIKVLNWIWKSVSHTHTSSSLMSGTLSVIFLDISLFK